MHNPRELLPLGSRLSSSLESSNDEIVSDDDYQGFLQHPRKGSGKNLATCGFINAAVILVIVLVAIRLAQGGGGEDVGRGIVVKKGVNGMVLTNFGENLTVNLRAHVLACL